MTLLPSLMTTFPLSTIHSGSTTTALPLSEWLLLLTYHFHGEGFGSPYGIVECSRADREMVADDASVRDEDDRNLVDGTMSDANVVSPDDGIMSDGSNESEDAVDTDDASGASLLDEDASVGERGNASISAGSLNTNDDERLHWENVVCVPSLRGENDVGDSRDHDENGAFVSVGVGCVANDASLPGEGMSTGRR